MPSISPLILAPLAIFSTLIVLAAVGMPRSDPAGSPPIPVGRPAPALPEQTLDGFPVVPDDVFTTTDVTIVNFWASWCPPCRAEHPQLLQMQADGFSIIGVNFKDTAAAASRYLSDDGNPFRGIAFDPQGRASINWGVTAPPETFIVDGKGTVLFRFSGPLVGSDYEQRFLPELNKALSR